MPWCYSHEVSNVGSFSPARDGKYGQAELTGGMWEMVMDDYLGTFWTVCSDCWYSSPRDVVSDYYDLTDNAVRGRFWRSAPVTSMTRGGGLTTIGFRCARAPR
jgi:hypothetical protein